MATEAAKLDTLEGLEGLHIRLLAENTRVDALVLLLRDIDRMCISLCSSFNDILQETEDEVLIDKLTFLREGVMASEAAIRGNIEYYERAGGLDEG